MEGGKGSDSKQGRYSSFPRVTITEGPCGTNHRLPLFCFLLCHNYLILSVRTVFVVSDMHSIKFIAVNMDWKMRDVLLISLAFTWHLTHQHLEEPERGGCPFIEVLNRNRRILQSFFEQNVSYSENYCDFWIKITSIARWRYHWRFRKSFFEQNVSVKLK